MIPLETGNIFIRNFLVSVLLSGIPIILALIGLVLQPTEVYHQASAQQASIPAVHATEKQLVKRDFHERRTKSYE
jgi:hypothetical protein